MKLLDTIQNNLRLYQGMTQAKVSYDFLKTQKEEDLLRLSEQINQMDASKIILMLQESAVAYLIKDPSFLPDLIRLECEEKISINSINSMLAHAGGDVLSVNFKYEELYEVLTDERIFNQWKYEYLKYYSKCGFDSRQLLDLMDGISKLSSYTDFTLSELSNTERLLLIEPFFRSGLINEVISDRTVWKYFEEPEVKEILNICASSPIYDCRIHQEQIKEISRNAGSILKGIKSVLPYFPQKCQDGFIEQWLENDMLVYDLKQLKRNLTSATEDALVRMVKNRTFYLNFLYGDFLAELNLENVSSQKQDMLIYALTHRKKHFLSVVKEYFSLFLKLPRYSLLMDKEVYTTYLNLNTLNGKNLQEACGLGCLSKEIRKCLTRKDYTFAELKLFVTAGKQYVYLYHQLYPLKYDERMKTIRELAGKECIPDNISEESLISIAEKLRQKPLSQWIHKELGHIENLSWNCAVKVLAVWNELERFIPGVRTEQKYMHYLPDDVILRAFKELNYSQYLIKSERLVPQKFTFYFAGKADTLPVLKGLNFDEKDAFVIEKNQRNDTIHYWVKDSLLFKQDTLAMSLTYLYTDTLNQLVPRTDTLNLVSKQKYKKEEPDKDKKKKKKKKGEEDEPEPTKFLPVNVSAPSSMDVYGSISLNFEEPIASFDTAAIHLRQKVDTLWKDIPFEFEQDSVNLKKFNLYYDWEPTLEYEFSVDSTAFHGIYGLFTDKIKQGFKVRSEDEYFTLHFNVTGADSLAFVELLDAQ